MSKESLNARLNESLNSGRAGALLEILMGVSEFNLPANEKTLLSPDGEQKWQMAMLHLQFVSQHGLDCLEYTDDKGHMHFSYEKEFVDWIGSGCPGVELKELEAFFNSF